MVVSLSAILCVALLVLCGLILQRAWQTQRALSRELKHTRTLLRETQQILEKRGALADQMAHEVKNPLSAIVCSAEALELMAGNLLPPDHRRCLGLIREFSDHVLRLVSDFLDLSRVEGGRVSPERSDVDVRNVLKGMYDLVSAPAARRNIELSLECSDESLIALVDQRHLKQVLFNLVQNALRYTPSGGRVSLRAACHEDTGVAIQVSDTGVGIDPEFMPRLFEPYLSGGNSSSGERGVGIGLSVCRSLIELNDGVILAQSELGKGSSFTVILPRGRELVSPSASRSFMQRTQRARVVEGRRVLVCEEGEASAVAAGSLLEAWGACVERVADAAALVKKLGEADFDAVLVSSHTLGEVGDSVLHRVHAQGGKVVATASDSAIQEAMRARGADAVIAAPVNGEKLLAGMEQAVQRRSTVSA